MVKYFAARKNTAGPSAALPAPSLTIGVDYPLGNPGVQTGWDTFSPPFVSSASSALDISVATRSSKPGNGVMIAGDGWDDDTYFKIFGQSGASDASLVDDISQTYRRTSIPVSSNLTMLEIPSSLPANSAVMLWPVDDPNVGAPYLINTAEAWYPQSSTTGYNACIVGDTISVTGSCLCKPILGTSSSFDFPGGSSLSVTVAAGLNISGTQAFYAVPSNTLIQQGNSLTGTLTYSGTTLTLAIDTTKTRGTAAGITSWRIYTTSYTWIYLEVFGQSAFVAATFACEDMIQFTLPASVGSRTLVANDSINVWVHNGMGGFDSGKGGWSLCSDPISVQTLTSLGMNYTAQSHAVGAAVGGTGVTDTSNIEAAITACGGTPGTVTFSTGHYKLTHSITVPANIKFKGNGKTNTFIEPAAGFSGDHFFDATSSPGFEQWEDMAINLGAATLTGSSTRMINGRRFVNCDIDSAAYPTIYTSGHGYITGCTVKGGAGAVATLLCGNTQLIASSDFYCAAGTDYPIQLGPQATITSIVDCGFHDPSGSPSRGRIMAPFGKNIHVFRLTSQLTPIVNDNGGEEFFFERGESRFEGNISAASNSGSTTVLTLDTSSGIGAPMAVMVRSGKGIGQIARVKSVSGSDVTLDTKWRVLPDTGSLVSIIITASRGTFHDMLLGGVLVGGADTAQRAYGLFGGGAELTFKNFHAHDMTHGWQTYSLLDLTTTTPSVPMFWIQTIDASAVDSAEQTTFGAYGHIGCLWRNVYCSSHVAGTNSQITALNTGHFGLSSAQDLVLRDGCLFIDTFYGMDSGGATTQETWLNTTIDRGSATLSGSIGRTSGANNVHLDLYGTSQIVNFATGNYP